MAAIPGSGLSGAEYAETLINPILTPALAALAREKPADPVTWLAEYLLAHKPPSNLMPPGTGDALAALMAAMGTQEGFDELHALFNDIDKNGDGSVSGKEWGSSVSKNKAAMSKFFGGLTKKELGQAFNKLDTDGSGDLTWDEFVAGVAAFDAAARTRQALATTEGASELKQLFASLDLDGNGSLTAEEWAAGLGDNKQLIAKYFGAGTSKKALKKVRSPCRCSPVFACVCGSRVRGPCRGPCRVSVCAGLQAPRQNEKGRTQLGRIRGRCKVAVCGSETRRRAGAGPGCRRTSTGLGLREVQVGTECVALVTAGACT